MNFEKKLSEAYLEFKDAMDKKKENLDGKGEKTVDDKDKDKDKEEIERKVSKKKKKDSYEKDYWKTIYPDDYAEKLISEEDSKEKK